MYLSFFFHGDKVTVNLGCVKKKRNSSVYDAFLCILLIKVFG